MAKTKGPPPGIALGRGRVRGRTPLAATAPKVARTVAIPGALAVPAGRRVPAPSAAGGMTPPGVPSAGGGKRGRQMANLRSGKVAF